MVKNMVVIVGLMALGSSFYPGEEVTESAPNPAAPTINLNLRVHTESGSVSASQSDSVQSTWVSVRNKNVATMAAFFTVQLDKANTSLHSFASYCSENKFKISCYGLAAAYCYIFYRLKKLEYALCNDHSWSLWKKQQSLQELYMINDDELINDLLIAIQGRYTNLHNLDDFNTPLTFFIKDVDQEGRSLTLYIKLARRLSMFKIGKLFSINKKLLEEAAQRKERLNYLKSRIWNWVSAHKVSQHC